MNLCESDLQEDSNDDSDCSQVNQQTPSNEFARDPDGNAANDQD